MPNDRVLIIVQNLPVPLDRRVWLECQALRRAGYEVSVICPQGPGDRRREVIDGVRLYKYRPAPEARGLAGYTREFALSWLKTAALSVSAWRDGPFAVVQACNPPDTYWLLAAAWRRRGVRFVYDQHDLNPELFESRFGPPVTLRQRAEYAALRWLERRTYRRADHVIATNESYRRIALARGGKQAGDVTVVRSGPDTRSMRPVGPPPEVRALAPHVLVYLGIMGPQDGVDQLLRLMDELVHRRGRRDLHLVLLGFGDCLEALKREAHERGLDGCVTFTGRVGPDQIADYLSTADLGLGPDLKTPLNDVSTMNKTMEYMAYCLPSVSFDLTEVRVSAGDTGVYVPSGDIVAFADAVESLLGDPERRATLGVAARSRAVDVLDWRPQSDAYVGVYDRLLGRARHGGGEAVHRGTEPSATPVGRPPRGRTWVDLDDAAALWDFVRDRGRTRSRREQPVP